MFDLGKIFGIVFMVLWSFWEGLTWAGPGYPGEQQSPTVRTSNLALCEEWWGTARSVGWPDELLPTLGDVMWHESRCDPTQTNPATEDAGLVQVNRYWHERRVNDLGYEWEYVYKPEINLYVGYQIYLEAERFWGCGWQPWTASGHRC